MCHFRAELLLLYNFTTSLTLARLVESSVVLIVFERASIFRPGFEVTMVFYKFNSRAHTQCFSFEVDHSAGCGRVKMTLFNVRATMDVGGWGQPTKKRWNCFVIFIQLFFCAFFYRARFFPSLDLLRQPINRGDQQPADRIRMDFPSQLCFVDRRLLSLLFSALVSMSHCLNLENWRFPLLLPDPATVVWLFFGGELMIAISLELSFIWILYTFLRSNRAAKLWNGN